MTWTREAHKSVTEDFMYKYQLVPIKWEQQTGAYSKPRESHEQESTLVYRS